MDVEIRENLPGCLTVGLGVMTLGIFTFAKKYGEGNMPRTMDDAGIVTRNGKRYLWSDFTRVTRKITRVKGRQAADETMLYAKKGFVSLHTGRLKQPAQVLEFALRRVPPQLLSR